MTYDWGKSQFTAADLNGKTVSVRIPLEAGGIYDGDAKLEAVQDHRGFIRVAVIYFQMAGDASGVTASKIFVPAEALAQIVRNPAGSKCEFSLRAV